jgi:hypothetical protein
MVRYPLGGMMSWVLQYLVGFQRLGHDVYFVEKSGYANACYDPMQNVMTDNCTYGIKTLNALLKRFGLQDRWCFVDEAGLYYGLSRNRTEEVFNSADIFIDMGTHGTWLHEARGTTLRVLIDGEPGFTQIKMENMMAAGKELFHYDCYYTVGKNVGTERSTAPTGGQKWHQLFHPVVVDLFDTYPVSAKAPFTTVMNWQSYEALEYNGIKFGHKDLEFNKFIGLPQITTTLLEIAVSGENLPTQSLLSAGWSIRDAHDVTISFNSFKDYIGSSRGEFSVCKNGYVATNSGWFSDRSAAYLASGRPVVMQDTGFNRHLPCGQGLFAVNTVEEAAGAINEIQTNFDCHSVWARDVAFEYLDASKVLKRLLNELGI